MVVAKSNGREARTSMTKGIMEAERLGFYGQCSSLIRIDALEPRSLHYKKVQTTIRITLSSAMLFQTLILLPFVVSFVEAGVPKHPKKCYFELKVVPPRSLKPGIAQGYLKTSGAFTELTTKNIKDSLAASVLVTSLKQRYGERYEFEVAGYCIPEPGWSIAKVTTVNSVKHLQLEMLNYDKSTNFYLQRVYPNLEIDEVLYIRLTFDDNLTFKDFFIEFEVESADPSKPREVLDTRMGNFIFFPPKETNVNRFEWNINRDKERPTDDLEADYICILDLLRHPCIEMRTRHAKLRLFRELLPGASPMEGIKLSSILGPSERSYARKDILAAYVLDALSYKEQTRFYGLVLARESTSL